MNGMRPIGLPVEGTRGCTVRGVYLIEVWTPAHTYGHLEELHWVLTIKGPRKEVLMGVHWKRCSPTDNLTTSILEKWMWLHPLMARGLLWMHANSYVYVHGAEFIVVSACIWELPCGLTLFIQTVHVDHPSQIGTQLTDTYVWFYWKFKISQIAVVSY